MLNCGDALLIPAPGLGNTHLWVVITAPDPRCIIVNLTTLRLNRDQTVVLQAGDHPFVKHQTAVLYSDARIVDANALEAQVLARTAQLHQPCPVPTLRLIQAGITASPYTPRKVEEFFREWKRAQDGNSASSFA